MRKMSAALAPARPSLGRTSRLRGETAMDPLFCAGLLLLGRRSKIRRPVVSATGPSGAVRLLLALAVIAAIVGVLARASAVSPRNLASTTFESQLGEPR